MSLCFAGQEIWVLGPGPVRYCAGAPVGDSIGVGFCLQCSRKTDEGDRHMQPTHPWKPRVGLKVRRGHVTLRNASEVREDRSGGVLSYCLTVGGICYPYSH
eukprot:1176579-Prorocentrum_minimum.AAC.4